MRKLFAMNYSGRSNYVVYDTPKGRMAFRLTDHNAFGKNFERDKAKQNISVFVGRDEYGVPELEIPSVHGKDAMRLISEMNTNKSDFAKMGR